MIITNSTPLIFLGKQGYLDLFRKCFNNIIIPKKVYQEIIEKKDSPEAIALEKAINESWIKVEEINISQNLKTQKLGQGEKEAISLATKHNSILIIDDDTARSYSELFGIETHGTLYVIFLACKKNIINKKQSKEIIEQMITNGFYISTEVYSQFLDLLDSI